ncbi:MAG TPA: peptidoglycan-associated lipoprotein Pal [Desulfuromonadales bacterium]|nr:peptidoglycan-associated lipoprotein Pal [Desulfuromonadales bacterium]
MKYGKPIILLMVSLAFSLSFGCAKTPTADDASEETPGQVSQTDADGTSAADRSSMSETEISESEISESEKAARELSLKRIHFDFDRYTLSTEARQKLENNAKFLRANPQAEVQIQGHTDERGSDSYNLALGEKRARAAHDYLVSLGISPARLSIISYGEERPMVPESNEEAWARNRRVEFVLR